MDELLENLNLILLEKQEKIIPENIRKGIKLFDVDGSLEILDTSDADATAADIMKDKTAYVNGEKIVGTHEEAGGDTEYNTLISPKDAGLTTFDVKNSITKIGDLDLTGVTSMSSAFSGFYKLTEIKSISNSSQVTNMSNMFDSCQKINEIPYFDTSNVTNMYYMFRYCYLIKTVPQFNTTNVTNMQSMFDGCSRLASVPLLDTSNVTNMNRMFAMCELSLKEIPQFNTSKVLDFGSVFIGCRYLETIPALDASRMNKISSVFQSCTNLKNIGGFLNIGNNYTQKTANYGNYMLNLSACTALTHDSLMNIINGLYDLNLSYDVANGGTLYAQQLQIGSSNKAKLTADEIALATAKRMDG